MADNKQSDTNSIIDELSKVKLGDNLYDVGYGGIMLVRVVVIETYNSLGTGMRYTITAQSSSGLYEIYQNDDFGRTVFFNYNDACKHMIRV